MKYLISLMIALISFLNLNAQDTIEVSIHKTTVIIFESNVLHDDIGSSNLFINTIGEMVKLKAKSVNFKETSLFIKTEKGYHDFVIRYKENPKKVRVMIKENSSNHISENNQVTEKIESNDKSKIVSTSDKSVKTNDSKEQVATSNTSVFDSNCKKILNGSRKINDIGVINKKTIFQLVNVFIKDDLMYFQIDIKNSSNIDYDIDLIKFTIRGNQGKIKQASVQEEELDSKLKFIYNDNINEVKGKSTLSKVYVFDKFTYAENKQLFVEVWEKGGDRICDFSIPYKTIINVNKL